MSGTERPAHVLPVPRWTLIIHVVQIAFAIIVLGLDAYGIRWIPYNALIFSLVVAILTLAISVYALGTQLFLHNFYNMYAFLGLHILMIIFWIVDLGLVANLARLWSGPQCTYSYYTGYYCTYGKRDLNSIWRREETTYKSYYGALAAGAFFAAAEFGLWVLSLIILVLYMNRHRSNPSSHSTYPPPQYTDNNQAVPLENKYQSNQTVQPQPQQYQQPQQQYSAAPTPQTQYAQPAPYPYDPVNRTNTVSPVSHTNPNASELGTPQHTGDYNPNASQLGTPQYTGDYNPNVSELSSPQHTGAYHPNVSELPNQK